MSGKRGLGGEEEGGEERGGRGAGGLVVFGVWVLGLEVSRVWGFRVSGAHAGLFFLFMVPDNMFIE